MHKILVFTPLVVLSKRARVVWPDGVVVSCPFLIIYAIDQWNIIYQPKSPSRRSEVSGGSLTTKMF